MKPLTPDDAVKAMRKIARRARKHPRKANARAVDLLCEIARRTGYAETADLFARKLARL